MRERTFRIILAVLLFFSFRDCFTILRQMQEFEESREEEEYVLPDPLDAPLPVDKPVETVEKFLESADSPVNDVNNPVVVPIVEEPWYTEWQHEILAIIIYQEAGGDDCSDDTRRKVGSVFLNRVNSSQFPDTFEEVATGRKQYGTLYLTGIKWPDRASLPQEEHAVQRAYNIAEDLLINGSILPDNVIWQAEFRQGDGVYCEQDGFYFCYSEVNE